MSCGAAAGAAEDFLRGRSSIWVVGFTGFTEALFFVPFCVLLFLNKLVNFLVAFLALFLALCRSDGRLTEGVAKAALFP
jgi:hypothetical protein